MPKRPRPGLKAWFHRFYWGLLVSRIHRINKEQTKLANQRNEAAKMSAGHYTKGWETW